ncbi:MAG: chain-length determining protein [Alloprevotella sp.]
MSETNNVPVAAKKEEGVSLTKREIRLDILFGSLWRNKKKYVLPLVITFVVSSLLVVCIPRYYTVKVTLAPEASIGGGEGGLSSLASMAGINLSSMNSGDAIIPMFYPDVMSSTDFVVPLLAEKVKTADGEFEGTVADYMSKHQKAAWWNLALAWVVNKLKPAEEEPSVGGTPKPLWDVNPKALTKRQERMVEGLARSVGSVVDKKTDVITISATAQDPQVAAQLAEIATAHLQEFIIIYRTKKAKNDLEHYQKLYRESEAEYHKTQGEYAAYADSHQDVVQSSFRMKEQALENELQLAFNQYSQLKQQVQLAEAKVMERTPAFTVIQNATVPTRPTGPKRMISVLAFLVLCFLVTSAWILVKDPQVKF